MEPIKPRAARGSTPTSRAASRSRGRISPMNPVHAGRRERTVKQQNVSRRRRNRRNRGMTLIEIIVVLAILGLIASAVTVGVMQNFADARVNVAKQEIGNIKTALDVFKVKKGKYPDT